jgi:exodeoxyribonuclease VII small subunit
MSGRKPKTQVADFEARLKNLEDIVSRMETGQQSLEQSLLDFEKGMGLCQDLSAVLEQAEQRIQKLVGEPGKSELQEMTPDGDDG